jgi:exopolyphosphatase/guanosine-5'-triphosphate,3'-diphosphate pyrophosphatase
MAETPGDEGSTPASEKEAGATYAAAADLGSNSFHMIVGRLDDGKLTIVDKLRERVRLASGLSSDGNITKEAADRAIACLEQFGQRIQGMPADRVRVVGTNTLRKAKNARAFMERAQAALGYPIDIVSGREEARLIYLGVAQTNPDLGPRLVIDIGGGSTEFIIGEGFDITEADSLFMGCVSFSERYFGDGEITAKRFREAQLAAELELQSIAARYRRIGWNTAIGCSGTIHAVTRIVQANGWADDGVTLKSLKKLRKSLIATGCVDDVNLPGLVPDRKPVICGGTAILEALFVDLRVEQLTPSSGAMREGVLYDLVGRINQEDVRDRTIRWFQKRYQVETAQAELVEQTTLTLLHQATRFWELDEKWAEKHLSWAARLHEMGLAIAHTGYHKHGAYLVRHSHLAGFSSEEQRTLATLIATQRRKLKPDMFDELDPTRVQDVMKLCVLFRLAVRLNRGRDTTRPPFVLKLKKDRIKLNFPSGWLDEHPLTRTALEEDARYLSSIGYQLSLHEAA